MCRFAGEQEVGGEDGAGLLFVGILDDFDGEVNVSLVVSVGISLLVGVMVSRSV